MKAILPIFASFAVFCLGSAAGAEMKLPEIKTQSTPQAVLDEHLDAKQVRLESACCPIS
jgi:hypothetical protein